MKKFFLMLAVMFTSLAASAQSWELVKSNDYANGGTPGWGQAPEGSSFAVDGGVLKIVNPTKAENNWNFQYQVANGISIEEGLKYQVRITIDAEASGSATVALCPSWTGSEQDAHYGVAFTTEKKEIVVDCIGKASSDGGWVLMQTGDFVGTINIYKVDVYKEKIAVSSDDPVQVFNQVDVTAENHVAKVYDNQFSNVSGEITVVSPAKVKQDWDTQFWFVMKEALAEDAAVTLTFDAKASSAQTLSTGAHGAPDGNNWKSGGVFTSPSVTTEWKTFNFEIKAKAGWQSFALDLTKAEEVTYYFKNIKITKAVAESMDAPLTITEAGWATFYAPFAVTLGEGLKAYIVEGVNADTSLSLKEVSTVPAFQPVVVEGPATTKTYTLPVAKRGATSGILTGFFNEAKAPAGAYVLQSQKGKVGFYKADGTQKVGANHAYLTVPAADSAVKAYYFDAAATAIEQLTSASEKTIYDLSGRKLNKLQKGINIVNGVKVLVK